MNKVLIIDDEEKLRSLLAKMISLEGYEVAEVGDIKSGYKKVEQYEPDVILCDVKLPDGSGVELTKNIKSKYPHIEIILMTAYGNIPDGVQAIKNGAFDYLVKGDDNNRILPLLERAIEKASMAQRILQLEKQVGEQYSFDRITGKSNAIKKAIDLATKVAVTDTTVLLSGETGTGKEVFAQAIHQLSTRARKSFVAVNCAAIGKDLLESEMFGYKAGAFTGAVKDKKGYFEEANGGTLFLDELGEFNLELQAKLLRVLESGEFVKVGDTKTIKVNVRVIAATNRDLKKDSEVGLFRSDLYYRLSVFQIHLPSLKERRDDIPLLVEMFLNYYARKANKKIDNVAPEFIEKLTRYHWPGNVRELRNIIERTVILYTEGTLTVDYLPVEFQQLENSATDHSGLMSPFSLSSVEKLHIQKMLNHTNGNKTEAARLMNIGLTTLYRKIEEYHIKG